MWPRSGPRQESTGRHPRRLPSRSGLSEMVGSEVPRENIGVYPYFEPFKGIERAVSYLYNRFQKC